MLKRIIELWRRKERKGEKWIFIAIIIALAIFCALGGGGKAEWMKDYWIPRSKLADNKNFF